MSIVRSATVALSAAACASALLTGAKAPQANHSAARQAAAQPPSAIQAGSRFGAGHTVPGQGWVSYENNTGLFIDVDTRAAGFTGQPVYTSSVGGIGGQWALTGTSAIYSPTATKFRLYIRWSDGHPITPADAQRYDWHVNWIGVETT